jgi:hypothetical protein
VLQALAAVELHARTFVHHGYATHAQRDVLHDVTSSDFSPMLFYFSEHGHPGPRSFSSSRRLYRKKPDKLGLMQQKQAGLT